MLNNTKTLLKNNSQFTFPRLLASLFAGVSSIVLIRILLMSTSPQDSLVLAFFTLPMYFYAAAILGLVCLVGLAKLRFLDALLVAGLIGLGSNRVFVWSLGSVIAANWFILLAYPFSYLILSFIKKVPHKYIILIAALLIYGLGVSKYSTTSYQKSSEKYYQALNKKLISDLPYIPTYVIAGYKVSDVSETQHYQQSKKKDTGGTIIEGATETRVDYDKDGVDTPDKGYSVTFQHLTEDFAPPAKCRNYDPFLDPEYYDISCKQIDANSAGAPIYGVFYTNKINGSVTEHVKIKLGDYVMKITVHGEITEAEAIKILNSLEPANENNRKLLSN